MIPGMLLGRSLISGGSDPYTVPEFSLWKNTNGRTEVNRLLVGGESTAVLVAFGQSNIASWASGSYTATQAKNHNYNILNGGCYSSVEPLLGVQWSPDIPRTSNFLTRLADKLITAGTYQRVILVPFGAGGTKAADWAGTGAFDCKALLTCALRRLTAASLTPTHFLFQLGESDAAAGTSTASFKTSVNAIVDYIRTFGFTAAFGIAKSTHWTGTVTDGGANMLAIQAACDQLVDHVTRNIWAGPNSDSLDDTNRADGVHWNATGADANATLWKNAMALMP